MDERERERERGHACREGGLTCCDFWCETRILGEREEDGEGAGPEAVDEGEVDGWYGILLGGCICGGKVVRW